MSKIIILKAVEDTVNIKEFNYGKYSIQTIQITKYLEKFLKLDINSKNIFIKLKNSYYNYLVVNELKTLIKEDSVIILSKTLKKYKLKLNEIFNKYSLKYNVKCKINENTINIEKIIYDYIKSIEKIYSKNIAFLINDINKLDKEMYILVAKISKKLDIITKEVPKINRINTFVEKINEEYGMFNEIKDIKDLRDYSIIVNFDKKIESLQLFTYNKQTIYIDCKNIFSKESYNYLSTYNISKYLDKENLNILLYLDLLKDKELYKNINILYKENQIYISELLYLLDKRGGN